MTCRELYERLTELAEGTLPAHLSDEVRSHLEGCSFEEIAGAVGATEGAVKMRFQRGLRLLRHELELQGIEP